jgi:molybdopterin converting factor subunit 1
MNIQITVLFFAYLRDVTGCAQTTAVIAPGTSVAGLLQALYARFPRLADLERSTLVAVGMDYQGKDYVLKEGDEVALFPPVQGG